MLQGINARAAELFCDLSGLPGQLRVVYRSSVLDGGELSSSIASQGELAHLYRQRLEQLAAREVEQAVSLVGPHRDDFAFVLGDVDLNTYGSRGQQRLAVLTLKLAEAEWMCAEIGEVPVLLLDDLLSELDPRRRRYVLDRVARLGSTSITDGPTRQVWLTATDLDDFPPELLAAARRFDIDAGTVRAA
jgi:DNA replication and repair protein RecF